MIHRLLNSLVLLPDAYHYLAPADLGLQDETVTFPNQQGLPLHGLFCWQASQTADARVCPEDLPVVLFCPGTSGNLSAHLHYVELLCRAGFAVLGFDYTGFGRSAGKAWLKTLLTDVLCAGDYLHKQRHIERFALFGLSIGANVALLAAATQPGAITGVAIEGLALQTEVVRGILTHGVMGPRYIHTVTYNGVPQPRQPHVVNPVHMPAWLANLLAPIGMAAYPFQAKDPLRSASMLANTPVFFIHGVDDPLLPFEAALTIYNTKPGTKRLWLMPDIGHAQEAVLANDGEYSAQLGDFFHSVLGNPASSCQYPSPRWETITDKAGQPMLRLYNDGPPGAALITFVGQQTIDFITTWMDDTATVPYPAGQQSLQIHVLRLFAADQDGQSVTARLTPRSSRYQTVFQSYIRELSRLLHENRLAELDDCLKTLPQEKPEAPFDFFLGVYCSQIMRRSRNKRPHLARAAAEAFTRYWPDGANGTQEASSDFRALVAAILDESNHQPTNRRTGR
jgi:pimeloyl-ACP methyl ester carboxylesterase